jgi:hypothetical protein
MIEWHTGASKIAEVQFKLLISLDRRLHVLELVTHPNYICSFVKDRKGLSSCGRFAPRRYFPFNF